MAVVPLVMPFSAAHRTALPSEVHLALIRTHGQADIGLIDHFLVGEGQVGKMEPDVGAAMTALVQLRGYGVRAGVKDAQVQQLKRNCL